VDPKGAKEELNRTTAMCSINPALNGKEKQLT